MAKGTTGLASQNVWNALERKGLARSLYPEAIVLTADGVGYETGLEERVLLRADH